MTSAPRLTADEARKASECDCGIQREMKQGKKKTGGDWRGEFCVLNECQPLWWRWNPQIELWIAPIYDPYEFVYLGLEKSPWEHLDPQPKEAVNDESTTAGLHSTERDSLRS